MAARKVGSAGQKMAEEAYWQRELEEGWRRWRERQERNKQENPRNPPGDRG